MKHFSRFLPFVLIIISACIFFYPFLLQGKLPIPADTITGLYYPFRDIYRETNPNGLPYKNFLVTDPVRQQYPWKNLTINQEKEGVLPLWNPYEMAGTPLLANFQSSAFYPLNLLLFVSPFYLSWSVFILLQPILAGIFLYLYLKHLKLDTKAALLGSFVWAFCGFSTAWLEWGVIVHTALWIPLILLAKDMLLKKWSIRWAAILVFSELSAFLAGHLQVFFYVLCLVNVYLFFKILLKSYKKKQMDKILTFIKLVLPFAGLGVIIFLIASPQIFSTFQFILNSNRAVDQSFMQPGWFIPYQNLVQFVAPDFFGNPATLNYWGVWNYAEFVGYIGIPALILSLYAILFRHDKKTYFFAGIVFISLLFATDNIISRIPYLLKIPFLATSQPTRLMVLIDFSLAVLSCLGLDYFLKHKKNIWIPILLVGVVFCVLWLATFMGGVFPSSNEALIAKNNLKFPTLIFAAAAILVFSYAYLKIKKLSTILIAVIFILVLFDLLRFGWKFTPFSNKEYLYPDTKVTTFLQKQKGVFRIATTDSRILPPNFSVIYKLQSIEGYDPLYLSNYAEFIVANEREDHSITQPFGFNRIITPRSLNTQAIDFLNVKYVLSLSDISSPKFNLVLQDGETKIYENKNVLERAFFVENTHFVGDKSEAAKHMFDYDLSNTAIIVGVGRDTSYSTGSALITTYIPNKVSIATDNPGTGFLILSDVMYPFFHATIDSKEVEIIPVNLAFRGIVVPKGKHTIEFVARTK